MRESTSPERTGGPRIVPTPAAAGPVDPYYAEFAEAIPLIAWTTDVSGRIQHANSRWSAYTGREPRQGTLVADDPAIHPDDVARLAERWAEVVATEGVLDAAVRVRQHDGEYHSFQMRVIPSRDGDGRVSGWVGTSTDIDGALRDARSRENARFLADAGQLLGGSLDYEATIQGLADLAVPRIADWCAIDLLTADGELRSLAIAHADPAKVEVVRQLLDEYPDDPEQPSGPAKVVRTGQPVLAPDIPPEALESVARDERHAELLRSIDLRSYMCVPLKTGDRVIGALALASSRGDRRFDAEDLLFAENLAARASSAIENAKLYREADRFRADPRLGRRGDHRVRSRDAPHRGGQSRCLGPGRPAPRGARRPGDRHPAQAG